MDLFQNFPQIGSSGIIVLALTAWTLVWKGLALWTAAHDKQKQWFIAILILNTVGILEIAYLFVFSKNKLQVDAIIPFCKAKLNYLKSLTFKSKQ